MAEKQVNQIRWEDGRHAERHVVDWHVAEDGTEQREVELYLEPERQLNLKQRVVEKRKPVVYHRKTQVVEGDKVVEEVVEERDEDKLQIVDHIATVQKRGMVPEKSDPCGCNDLADAVRALVDKMDSGEKATSYSPRRLSRSEVAGTAGGVASPLQDTVGNRVGGSTALVVINAALTVTIVGLLAAIGACLIFM